MQVMFRVKTLTAALSPVSGFSKSLPQPPSGFSTADGVAQTVFLRNG